MQEKDKEEKDRAAAKKAFMCQRATEYLKTVENAAVFDPIQTIVQRVRKGPLMLLRRAYQTSTQIDITTRHARGVKSIIRAEVHGFDKFMNLLLANGEEWLAHRTRVLRSKPVRSQPSIRDGAQAPAAVAEKEAPSACAPAEREPEQGQGQDEPSTAQAPCELGDSVQSPDEEPATSQGFSATRTQTRVGWRQVLRRRKLARVLLRGDQVVMIRFASGPLQLPRVLAHLNPADSNAT